MLDILNDGIDIYSVDIYYGISGLSPWWDAEFNRFAHGIHNNLPRKTVVSNHL